MFMCPIGESEKSPVVIACRYYGKSQTLRVTGEMKP